MDGQCSSGDAGILGPWDFYREFFRSLMAQNEGAASWDRDEVVPALGSGGCAPGQALRVGVLAGRDPSQRP